MELPDIVSIINFVNTNSFLPITVVSAIIIFIIKEFLDLIKRRRADNRKKEAIRTFLIHDCEKNNSSLNRMRKLIQRINDTIEFYEDKPEISKDPSGEWIIVLGKEDLGDGKLTVTRSSDLPNVYIKNIEKYLLDVALVDKDIFQKAISAYNSLNKMEHIRLSIIRVLDDDPEWFKSFSHYAVEVLDEIYDEINLLYKECTGNDLVEKKNE